MRPARNVTAVLNQNAAFAFGTGVAFTFDAPSGSGTSYKVPSNSALVIYHLMTTCAASLSGSRIYFRITIATSGGQSTRTFLFPAIDSVVLFPPIVVRSGDTVTIEAFNNETAGSAGAGAYVARGVVVRESDLDRVEFAAPPYFPAI